MFISVDVHVHGGVARINKQTDQTTTLCVQEVEIYLERWEVLGALVDVCARATQTDTDHHHLLLDLNSLFKYK